MRIMYTDFYVCISTTILNDYGEINSYYGWENLDYEQTHSSHSPGSLLYESLFFLALSMLLVFHFAFGGFYCIFPFVVNSQGIFSEDQKSPCTVEQASEIKLPTRKLENPS